ncbi:MAG TPA: lipase family protein [Solirubrobacteraceae bacterium]|jgi:hypothetical protein|nr:lipase family protein [Solirubrobacteraceae bacterium]
MRVRIRMTLVAALAAMAAAAMAMPAGAAAAPLLPSADPFYAWSGSLAGVAPGTILRTRQVAFAEVGVSTPLSATQVLYRTTGELGQPTVTVATILRPLLPTGTTKILSYQTAYDALGSECDPSYTLQGGNPGYETADLEENLMLAYVAQGDTVVTSDYEGETLDYGAGQESGYGTLDAIRATENVLKAAAASTPVALLGYSGGAIATDYAAELAPSYAPGLDLVGEAEGGVPVEYAHNLAYISGSSSWSGVIPAILVGLTRGFHVNTAPYLSAYGQQVFDQVGPECINNFLGAYPGLTMQKLLKPQYQDYTKVPIFVKIFNRMIMSGTGTPRGPMYIGNGNADGTGDGVMIAKDVQELAHTYCQRGVSVQFNIYKGLNHDLGIAPFETGALNFIDARLNGRSVPDGCSQVTAGNALTPLAVPATPAKHHKAKRHKAKHHRAKRRKRR